MDYKKETLRQDCLSGANDSNLYTQSIDNFDQKINPQYKADLINSPISKAYRQIRRALNAGGCDFVDGTTLTFDEALDLNFEMMEKSPLLWHDCERVFHSTSAKRTRAQKRIKCMFKARDRFGGSIYFVTFTFNDEYLDKTNADTRRQKVRRTLKASGANDYYGNIDYGAKNGREHYHALIWGDSNALGEYQQTDEKGHSHTKLSVFDEYEKKVGFLYVETVGDDADGSVSARIGKYIQKFVNHATKETVGADNALSKRGVDYSWLEEREQDPHIYVRYSGKVKMVERIKPVVFVDDISEVTPELLENCHVICHGKVLKSDSK